MIEKACECTWFEWVVWTFKAIANVCILWMLAKGWVYIVKAGGFRK